MEVDDEIKQNISNHTIHLTTLFTLEEEKEILKILNKLDVIMISNMEEIISWPYIIKKYNINIKDFKIICTEPVAQIGKYILNDFYNNFNKLLVKFDNNDNNNNSDINADLIYITDSDINIFIEHLINLNYKQKFELCSFFKVTLLSSAYSLGSSNILI